MKTRIVSGLAGILLLLMVVGAHPMVLGIAIFLVSLVAIYEFYHAVHSVGYRPVWFIGYLACLPILMIALNGVIDRVGEYLNLFTSIHYVSFSIFITLIVLFSFIIFQSKRYNVVDISLTFFGVLYVAFLFSFIVLTRSLENGFYYVWFIFIGAWATDTFAYFAGNWFGRRKLIPAVSPKKTVEGSIGGIIGAVVCTVLFGMFINFRTNIGLPIYHFIILGVLNSMISQIGDLAASAIKRFVKVKDYGAIMPGHGGMLDRFDSILFVAPVVYFYILFVIG